MMRFPQGFIWGVATSAHQVEGGNLHNQWVSWEAQGRIRDGSCCGRACNWWNEATQDLDLARHLGVNAVRVSIEWSRLEPQEGRWNPDALARYYTLLVEMHKRGLRPFLTLHHFTHPQWFEDRGGFLAPDAVETFSRFVYRTVEALHHVCCDWVTINEPNVYTAFGYMTGMFPPGTTGDLPTTLRVLVRLARCHAAAYRIIHQFQPQANVGWAHNYVAFHPATNTYRDSVATRVLSQLMNRSFFDLLVNGSLGAPWERFVESAPEAQDKFDFVGVNVYSRMHVTVDPQARATLFARLSVPDNVPQGDPATDNPYGECYPEGVAEAVRYAAQFGRPIYITENGVPDRADRIRPWLLVHVARCLHELLAAGCDIRGYFHWTLVDNFEWSEGWRLRFGLYELDPATQQRRPRPSAHIYSQIANANALPTELFNRYRDLSATSISAGDSTGVHRLFTSRSS